MNIDKKFYYKKIDYIKRGINIYFFDRKMNLLFITLVFILCIFAIIFIKRQMNLLVWVMLGLYVMSQISMPITIFLQENKRRENSKDMQTERHIQINQDGTNNIFGRDAKKLKWDSFYKIVIFKSMILLYFDANQAFMLPKRVMTKEEYRDVRKNILANTYIKKKVKRAWLL